VGCAFRGRGQRSYRVLGRWSHRLAAGPFVRLAPSIGEAQVFFEEIEIMANRIRRVWSFVLAVAPISAIVLVEAAMRRWN
jgi:hypothetical protein